MTPQEVTERSRAWLLRNTRLAEMEALLGETVHFGIDDGGKFYPKPTGSISADGLLRGVGCHADTPVMCIRSWFDEVDKIEGDHLLVAPADRKLRHVGTIWIEER